MKAKVTSIECSHGAFGMNKNVGLVLRGVTKEQIKEMLNKYGVVLIRRKK